MAELTTDQRLSAALLPMVSELGTQHQASRQNAQMLRAQGGEAMHAARVQEHMGDAYGEATDRLGELVEGLAAGTVRIVDESALRVEIAALVETVRLEPKRDGEPSSPILIAREMVADLKERGVLR